MQDTVLSCPSPRTAGMVPGWAAFGKDVSMFVQRGRHKTSLALSLIVSEGFVPNPRAFHFLEVRGWCESLWHS